MGRCVLREWVVRVGGLDGYFGEQWASKNSYSNSIKVGYARMEQAYYNGCNAVSSEFV